jgi:hypothetical protein
MYELDNDIVKLAKKHILAILEIYEKENKQIGFPLEIVDTLDTLANVINVIVKK